MGAAGGVKHGMRGQRNSGGREVRADGGEVDRAVAFWYVVSTDGIL